MRQDKLTQKRLKEVLHYNPETGIFRWKISISRSKIGDIAGTVNSNGYVMIGVDKIPRLASRLAFLYMIGQFPENQMDHINRIRSDNRWINLREVTNQCNLRNTGHFCTNTSGIKGVCYDRKYDKWKAYVYIFDERFHLGQVKDLDEAVCIRLTAEQCLGWNKCDSNSSAFQYVEKMIKNKKIFHKNILRRRMKNDGSGK